MKSGWLGMSLALVTALLAIQGSARSQQNLLPDASIEETQSPNQFGVPYRKWSGWLFEGAGAFRVGKVAHEGKTSAEMDGSPGVKMRLSSPAVTVTPGRYRFACYARGLDVGIGIYGFSEDVNFADDAYVSLKKAGTFGWTRLEIVKDVPKTQEVVFRIGLWGSGRLWVDDARLERVAADTPLTNGPVWGREEKPIAPPAPLEAKAAVHCPDCGYRNLPTWGQCYACGANLNVRSIMPSTRPVRILAAFENGKIAPFTPNDDIFIGAPINPQSNSLFALRIRKGYAVWDGPQDWTGYDFFKADVYNPGDEPANVSLELRDQGTTDYWTRVNYNTVVPPGASTLIVPTDLYVGEKSRPGRSLDKAHITRLVLNVEGVKTSLAFVNLRLERDLSDSVHVPGLQAFSFGPEAGSALRGFTPVSPATLYTPGRGYGLKNARVWHAFDVKQPDPLYQRIMCIESGGFAVDLPDGKYHVFLNLDSPSGFWGEYQTYRKRTVKANGVPVVQDTMDLPRFLQKYFRYADVEDRPEDNTFDKYQRTYFQEKEFDADVKNGQLTLDFEGEAWANSVSALVLYPASQDKLGKQYLANLRERRRFYFDNYFKRVLPNPRRDSRGVIPAFAPTPQEQKQGYALFARDPMEDVPINGIPRREEVRKPLDVCAAAGQQEPLAFSLHGLRDNGAVTVAISDLKSKQGVVPASAVRMGIVSHRLTRVTGEGTVYTIAPRFILPRNFGDIRKGDTTTFWLTLRVPQKVTAGDYQGQITLRFADGRTDTLPVHARLFATPLDELDVPAGPWGSTLNLPWVGAETGDYNREMFRKSLAKMREYGCTTFSGIPTLNIRGWNNRVPDIDFAQADREMADARELGFRSIVVNYNGGIGGFNNYNIDEAAMKAAGFDRYPDFLRAVLTVVDAHARTAKWLPVAYNLCDEPIGDDAVRAAENARAWREAAPEGILTTGATSVQSSAPANDPHLALARALKIANLNLHDEAALKAIKDAGGTWAFYNDGSRWTFGTYMFKCAQEYGMKFRLSWHWNAAAGDPYYALDSREDDYAWVATNARRELIPAIHFERDIRGGIDDYRAMLTLSRLLRAHPNHAHAADARRLLDTKLAAFHLGDRDHDTKWPRSEYQTYRRSLLEAIEQLAQ